MAKVSKRGGFSDRNSIKPENTEIQLKNFDMRTRIQLQNMISSLYCKIYCQDLYWGRDYIQDFFRFLLGSVYSEPVDSRIKYDDDHIFDLINETIKNDDYDDVLTLIESIIQFWDNYLKDNEGFRYYDRRINQYVEPSIFEYVNSIFKEEYIGYRFIDGIIVPISDPVEVGSINEALCTKFDSVREHISKANRLLSSREKPDYENTIKESISAVEAICEIITGIKGKEATLGNMLKKLEENNIEIHKGLKSAFNTLYGYTSDAKGIRHAGDIGGPSSTFEEAKFMLVACCAFINYLTALISD